MEPPSSPAAAAAGGSAGVHVLSLVHRHGATSPRLARGQLGRGPPWFLGKHLSASPAGPGVPAIPPACSKPPAIRVVCERGRAVLPFPHILAPSWCPPLPACPGPADPGLHQLSSWKKKKPSFLSGAIWGGWAFIPEPGQCCTPSRRPWPRPSSHGGRSAGAPSLQRWPSTRIPQPLTATERLLRGGGEMERPWGDPSGRSPGMLGVARWVPGLPQAIYACKDWGLPAPVASLSLCC